MSTELVPAADSLGHFLLADSRSAEFTNRALATLAQESAKECPDTQVSFFPKLVGYDNAALRYQWEEQFAHPLGEIWGKNQFATFVEWSTAPLGVNANNIPHTVKLGYFATETEPWVGKPAGAWSNQVWHAWGAALFPHPTMNTGKILVIYDCNVEAMMESYDKPHPDRYGDLEQKQRTLFNYLRHDRGYNIKEVWYGGKGNREDGICMVLTYDWCQKVLKYKGIPGGLDHGSLRAAGFWLLRNIPGGRGKLTPPRKQYVKKSEGGDGRGGKLEDGPSEPRRSGRSQQG